MEHHFRQLYSVDIFKLRWHLFGGRGVESLPPCPPPYASPPPAPPLFNSFFRTQEISLILY